jgi:hypothetical protein
MLTKWIQSTRLIASRNIFLYTRDAPITKRLEYSKEKWQGFLREGATIYMPIFGVIILNISTKLSTNN